MVRKRTTTESGDAFSIDQLDSKILMLMAAGSSNSEIAEKLRKPLSTVQRRTRQLLVSGIVEHRFNIDYKKFGYKTGLLHIYLSNGNTRAIAEKIGVLADVLKVTIHIGNSDLVADYACKSTQGLLDLMAKIKSIEGVIRIVWSEEVYEVPSSRKVIEIPVKG